MWSRFCPGGGGYASAAAQERERDKASNRLKMADSGWVLPDKYDKDLKDENGNPLSKSEFKKRQKAAEKAKKAAEKAAAKAAKPQPTKKKQVGPPRQMCAWTGSIPRPKIQTSRPPFATRLVASTPPW